MVIFKCKMCGANLEINEEISEEKTVCMCEYCGTTQTVPVLDNEKKANLFNRANRLRFNNEFDEAANVFGNIVAEFPEEAEGYWGLCLCKFGIEYVEDPATARRIPTCHRTCLESIFDDDDFKQACENAGSIARKVYREEAKEIDRLQQRILEIANSEEPYDIFICYKETDKSGERTKDSVLAQDIYTALTKEGYKVFFARISLEDKLGQEYEPYIFSALSTARIMLALGTDYDYFNAVWVKNEWSRFLDMKKTNPEKVLIPCYADIDAYDIPREFQKLQAQDMGKVGFVQDLVRGIGKIIPLEKEQPVQAVQPTVINQAAGTNVGNLLKRGFMALEEEDWERAQGFFERVLDENAEEPQAYLGLLMYDIKAKRLQELENCAQPFDDNANCKKAIRFGGEQLAGQLNGYNQKIRECIEEEGRKAKEEKKCKVEETRHTAEAEKESEIKRIRISLGIETPPEILQRLNEENTRFENEKHPYETEIKDLESEFSSLGMFSLKRKKEIQEEIAYQKQLLRSVEEHHEDIVHQIRGGGFGKYPRGENGKIAPIEWEILEEKDNKVLLISKYCIDCKSYHEKNEAVTWKKCILREWLNNEFLNTAFTVEQQTRIEATKITADKNPQYDTLTGKDTEDKIFLLSILEVEKYFQNDEARCAKPTGCAIKNGISINKRSGNSWWWLRSPGHDGFVAAVVDCGGGEDLYGNHINCIDGGVRPALWVNLNP